MATGLKTFLPKVAERLGVTPAALYEHQRKLMSLNLLEQRGGRGPGSGARLTSKNLATLLLSVLFTENPSQIDNRLLLLCESKALTDEGWCPFTGTSTLRSAVARLLEMPGPQRRAFHRLIIFRDRLEATLKFQVPGGAERTFFGALRDDDELHPITTTRELHQFALSQIASDYQSEIEQ